MPSDDLVARRAALDEKRRRIEVLKAQKAERTRQAATSQKSAASAAANLRSYVDGLLSQKSEAPKAPTVTTPNGTQLPPPLPPAAPRASTSPSLRRAPPADTLCAQTQTEADDVADGAAGAEARLATENEARALQDRGSAASQSARKAVVEIAEQETKAPDLSSLSAKATLVERCLGERDVFDALFAPSVAAEAAASVNFPKNARTAFHRAGQACTGVAAIWDRPEAFVAAYAAPSSEFDACGAEDEGGVSVWSLASSKNCDVRFACESGVASVCCDPRHPSLILGGSQSGQLLMWDCRSQKCVGKSPLDRHAPHASAICALSIRDDGTCVTGSSDGVVCLWAPGMLERPLEKQLVVDARGVTLPVSCVDFADDGDVYVGCEAGSVSLATFGNTGDHTLTCELLGAHRGRVTCVKAHPAARRGAAATSDALGLRRRVLASASVDWTCRLRAGATPLGAPLDHGAHAYVSALAWSPQRASLVCTAASDGCARLWNAAGGAAIGSAETLSTSALTAVAFSADGRRVVVGDVNGTCTVAALEASVSCENAAEAARLDELLGASVD